MNITVYVSSCINRTIYISFSDDKAESRGAFGPSAAGGRFCGYVVEERHEPGDGRAGEWALGDATHPHYPWPFYLGEHSLYQKSKSLWSGLTFRFSHLCNQFQLKVKEVAALQHPYYEWHPWCPVVSSTSPTRPDPSWFCQRHCIQTLLTK